MYFVDVAEQGKSNTNTSSDINYNCLTSYFLLQTVEANKSRYTKRDMKNNESARTLMNKLGHPYQEDFEHYLRSNLIRNSKRTVDIFEPEVHSLQGKTVKRKRNHVPTFIPVEISEQLEKSYTKRYSMRRIFLRKWKYIFPYNYKENEV